MGNFKGAARTALATLAILLTLPPAGARAEESLVIFSPAKISLHAYRLRMGARAAAEADMSAGVDLSVTTSSAGRISDTRDNARLWAEMKGEGRSGAERSVTAGYNPLTGRVSATLGVTRRWMPSQAIDVAVTPSVSADANMRHGARGSVRVTQKARISAVRTGTSFVASGTATTGTGGIGTEFGVEQRVFERLDLGASIRRQDAGLVGAVSAQLRFEW